jgi:aspartate aminotransferase
MQTVRGLQARVPDATFYLYVDARAALAEGRPARDIDELAAWLLDEQKLVVVPGSAFGDPTHFRMSFAAADEVLEEAFDRLEQAFGRN